MAFNFSIIFLTIFLFAHAYFVPIEYSRDAAPNSRSANPAINDLCQNFKGLLRTRKLICILCKGFDPSCFTTSTSTTQAPTTSTSTTTTTTSSTTSTSSTTPPTTTVAEA